MFDLITLLQKSQLSFQHCEAHTFSNLKVSLLMCLVLYRIMINYINRYKLPGSETVVVMVTVPFTLDPGLISELMSAVAKIEGICSPCICSYLPLRNKFNHCFSLVSKLGRGNKESLSSHLTFTHFFRVTLTFLSRVEDRG